MTKICNKINIFRAFRTVELHADERNMITLNRLSIGHGEMKHTSSFRRYKLDVLGYDLVMEIC